MKNLSITTTSQIPIYQQLFEQISSQILNGTIIADTQLPSVRTMAKELRVSIITIKKTWELLEHNDYIYTVPGKGSYVKKNTKNYLEKRKVATIKDLLKDNIDLSKKLNITKEELLLIVSELYDQ